MLSIWISKPIAQRIFEKTKEPDPLMPLVAITMVCCGILELLFMIKIDWTKDQHLGKEFHGDFGTFDVELNFMHLITLLKLPVLFKTEKKLCQLASRENH